MRMFVYKYEIPAGQAVRIAARGRFIRGLSSAGAYQVRFDGGPLVDFQTGIAFESPEYWDGIELFNNQAAAQTIEVVVSDGFVDDNRLVGNVDITGGIRAAANRGAAFGAATVGTTAAEVRPANSARGSILIQNNSAEEFFIGGDATVTAATGLKVSSGGSMSLTVTGAVWAIAATAGLDARYLEETL